MYITAEGFHSAYNELIEGLQTNGEHADPRGHKVLEMPTPSVWTIKNPSNWVPNIKHRRLNIFFALAEVVWMWSGNGSIEFIEFYNSSIKQFADPKMPYFHGSYGKRVRHYGYEEDRVERPWMPWTTRHIQGPDGTWGVYAGQEAVEMDQIQAVIKKLQADTHTRQAVICLWDAFKDNLVEGSKDYPCNNLVYSQIRDTVRGPELKMTVVMRSNDLVLGTPYNMIQFSHLQALIAGSLGVRQGAYSVMVNNLHMYEASYYPEAVRALVKTWDGDIYGNKCLFSDESQPTWDMRWNLAQFDHFIQDTWIPLEVQLRMLAENDKLNETSFMMAGDKLSEAFEDQAVPHYWRELFHMLMLWHIRKAKFEGWQEWTAGILASINPFFKALALDFDPSLGA